MTEWKIEVKTEPLRYGKFSFLHQFDYLLFPGHKAPCHSYMVLKNERGEIVSRLEGMAATDARGLEPCAHGIGAWANAAARSLGLSNIFQQAAAYCGFDDNLPELKGLLTSGKDTKHDTSADITVHSFSGSKEAILSRWLDACRFSEAVNKNNLPYAPIDIEGNGQNCHSFLAAAWEIIIGKDMPEQNFPRTLNGAGNDLFKLKELSDFDKNLTYEADSLEKLLNVHIQTAPRQFRRAGTTKVSASHTPDPALA